MAQRTALYDWHVSHGARMVEFAGWDMPIQYTSIIEEHQAVRSGVGVFDISHMGRLSFGGTDALDLIQHVYTNDAATMKDFQVRYGLICNEQGGILDDVLVYRWPYGFAMVVNAASREKISAWLAKNKGSRTVDIRDQTVDTCMVAVQGPTAVELCRDITDTDASQLGYYHAAVTRCMGKRCVISRTGYTGEDGFEIMIGAAEATPLWEQLIERGASPCGLGARDTLRLEAAMPLYGHELNEDIDPYQAGLGWAVKLEKGDFIGREALRQRREDKTLRRRVGLQLPSKRIAREGHAVIAKSEIRNPKSEVGKVTSGTFSPTLQKSIALAFVDPEFANVETRLEIDIRGKLEAAVVVKLPFYKRD